MNGSYVNVLVDRLSKIAPTLGKLGSHERKKPIQLLVDGIYLYVV